jgi:hypothetical protein
MLEIVDRSQIVGGLGLELDRALVRFVRNLAGVDVDLDAQVRRLALAVQQFPDVRVLKREILDVLRDHPYLRLLARARLSAFAVAGFCLFGHRMNSPFPCRIPGAR